MGNKIIKNIKVTLLQMMIIVDKNHTSKIKKILTKHHNDPIEAAHTGTVCILMKFLLSANDKNNL